MAIVNEITPDNIQTIGKTGKDVVDYITDQIDKVVNNKEEDKKNNDYYRNGTFPRCMQKEISRMV